MNNKSPSPQPQEPVLRQIQRALERLEFGTVQITVHQGRVVQIERIERYRILREENVNSGEGI